MLGLSIFVDRFSRRSNSESLNLDLCVKGAYHVVPDICLWCPKFERLGHIVSGTRDGWKYHSQ